MNLDIELRRPLAALSTALLDLLFPPRCAACSAALPSSDETFCALCADAVEPVPGGCPRCGQPGPPEPCGACLAHPPAFREVRAGALFGGPLADAVHAFKYRSRPALARPLGAWLAPRVALPEGALLVSVPLGRARRLARGYDQAALLAAALARASSGRVRRLPGALRRRRETPPQVGRTRAERSRNVTGAFEASAAVRGLDLFLVDDVVTTGATADACARALLAAGARSVGVVALSRAE
ncbi:MAG TPA: ComF family protein [Anaeromyxobacteraceae bacterium]|nr:ComF family protein [Anaeromyxobacteraceae bacterium]